MKHVFEGKHLISSCETEQESKDLSITLAKVILSRLALGERFQIATLIPNDSTAKVVKAALMLYVTDLITGRTAGTFSVIDEDGIS